ACVQRHPRAAGAVGRRHEAVQRRARARTADAARGPSRRDGTGADARAIAGRLSSRPREPARRARSAVGADYPAPDAPARPRASESAGPRAAAGEIRLARDRVDLGALAAAVVQSLDPVAQARGIALDCAVDGDSSVTGDAGWIERLLLNLLDNAIKFTPRDGHVSVRVSHEGTGVRRAARDSRFGVR